jgi:hypothetical protein
MRRLGIILLALGVIGVLISLPFLGFAALGHLGILADAGPAENHAMGVQALSFGLPPLICGVALSMLGLPLIARRHRRAATDPGTASGRLP